MKAYYCRDQHGQYVEWVRHADRDGAKWDFGELKIKFHVSCLLSAEQYQEIRSELEKHPIDSIVPHWFAADIQGLYGNDPTAWGDTNVWCSTFRGELR